MTFVAECLQGTAIPCPFQCGTPAEAGGLKVNDRIIEVNDANVVNESHAQIVERIKSVPNETRLLVLDPEADAYYEQRNILVTSAQSNVIYMKTPPRRPVSASYSSDDENDNRSMHELALEGAELRGTIADVTVRFVSDQVNLTTARGGEIVAGSDAITEVIDIWTFQRDVTAKDPTWKLVGTRSG